MDSFFSEQVKEETVRLAIIYEDWFAYCIPADWQRVGQWSIPNNVTCGDSMVSFYAINISTEQLATQLREYSSELPESVNEYGEYLKLQTKNKF